MPEGEPPLDGRYQLRREIHKSRRCIVYQACHLYTNRLVALKLLHKTVAADAVERATLFGEAQLLGSIRHACIPEVLDACEVVAEDGSKQPYLVMEMIDGRSLAGLLAARGRLEVPAAIALAQALASALRAVHEKGLIHQDVTPRNVLLPSSRIDRLVESRGGPIRLIDFGRAVHDMISSESMRSGGDDAYSAPEQLSGGAIDERTDVFAVGAVLYECLCGKLPYTGGGAPRYAVPAPSIHTQRPAVSPSVDEVVRQALAVDRAARFKDMGELMGALEWAQQRGAALAQPAANAAPPANAAKARSTEPPAISVAPSSEPISIAPISVPPSPTAPISIAPSSLVPIGSAPPRASIAPRPTDPPPLSARRRRHTRAAYLTPVRLLRSDGSALDCSSEDISEGGMLLLGPQVVTDDEHVQVRFALPISGKIISSPAIARWRRASRHGEGATGLEFVELPEAAAEDIAKYVEYFADPE